MWWPFVTHKQLAKAIQEAITLTQGWYLANHSSLYAPRGHEHRSQHSHSEIGEAVSVLANSVAALSDQLSHHAHPAGLPSPSITVSVAPGAITQSITCPRCGMSYDPERLGIYGERRATILCHCHTPLEIVGQPDGAAQITVRDA